MNLGRRVILVLSLVAAQSVAAQINTARVLAMGRSALFYEDYVVALQYFTMCVNAKPYLGEAYYYRALSKFYLGDYIGAEADANRAAEANPYIANLFPLRAICRVNTGHYAEAEDDYRRILTKTPSDAPAWHNLIMCQLRRGLYERADTTLTQMRQAVKDKSRVENLEAIVSDAREGRTIDTLKPAPVKGFFATPRDAQEGPTMQALYALNAYPSTSATPAYEAFYAPLEAINHQGIFPKPLYLTNKEGYVSEAIIKFHEADIETTTARLDRLPESSLLYLRRAVDYYSILDFEASITDLNTCVRLDTLNYLAFFLRAQARAALLLAQQGGQPDAVLTTENTIAYGNIVDDLQQVIRLEPQFVYAYYNLGTIYLTMRDYDRADQLLTQALALDAHLPSAYFNRGMARLANKQTEQALADLSQAAGEGIYTAYGLINRLRDEKK